MAKLRVKFGEAVEDWPQRDVSSTGLEGMCQAGLSY
jgi:hypothetical protein